MNPSILKILISIICISTTLFTLSQYGKLVQHLLSIKYNWLFELLMVFGMLLFQLVFIHKTNKSILFNYCLKMLLISLIGSLLVWPLLIINKYYIIDDIVNLFYFFSVVSIMFFIHKSIITKMKLPYYLSYTYILYRFIILLFIIL